MSERYFVVGFAGVVEFEGIVSVALLALCSTEPPSVGVAVTYVTVSVGFLGAHRGIGLKPFWLRATWWRSCWIVENTFSSDYSVGSWRTPLAVWRLR